MNPSTDPAQSGAIQENVIWAKKIDFWLMRDSHTTFLTNNGMVMSFFKGVASKYEVKSFTTRGIILRNYDKRAPNSFGEPQFLDLPSEPFDMTQNKAVNIRVDEEDMVYGSRVLSGGRVLGRFMREVFTPYRDEYIIDKIYQKGVEDSEGRVTTVNVFEGQTGAVDGNPSIYEQMVRDRSRMSNYVLGRHNMRNVVVLVPESNYAIIELDKRFSRDNEVAQKMVVFEGQVSKLGGLRIFPIPDEYFDNRVQYIFTAMDIVAAPYHIQYSKVHRNTPDFQGDLAQMRTLWDAHITKIGSQRIRVCRTDNANVRPA